MINYPKDLEENKKYRLQILAEADKNVNLQRLLTQKCKKDILYFFNMFLYTYKPKPVWNEEMIDNPHVPFITWDFQDMYIRSILDDIKNWRDNITEKTREMWFSWMILGILTWWFLYDWRSSLIGSYKEDYVDSKGNMDSHFERVRYMLDRLPYWMLPKDLTKNYMSIHSKELNCEIWWDSWERFWTWGRRTVVFLDEFSYWDNQDMAFRKTRDVTRCRIIWWTPNGRLNVYGKIMTWHKDYCHLMINKYRLHWSSHPLKTQEWYENEKKRRTAFEVATELDISYDDSVEGAVYPDFATLTKQGKYEYNHQLPTYTSWDFGRDALACLWFQKDFRTNQIFIVDAIMRVDWEINKFVAFVTWTPTQGYEYSEKDMNDILIRKWRKYMNHFWDPYNGDSRNAISSDTFKSELEKYWIYLTLKTWTTVSERIRATKLSLNRMYINSDLIEFVEYIRQARYPKSKEGSQSVIEKTKPVHDITSHWRTALEYFIDNEPQPLIKKTKDKVFYNPLTWKPIDDWFKTYNLKVYN